VIGSDVPSGDRPAGGLRSTRSPVFARNGAIATSQPLASAAGLQVLQEGGNAIDAAVTAAAVLGVVEPTMTGVGGDVFAIVFDARTRTLRGLNSSGRAGAHADAAALRARGTTEMPVGGPATVTVPGAVAGWAALLDAYGTIPLSRALAPAIRYAREGFGVEPIVQADWEECTPQIAADPGASATFLPGGRAPKPGALFRNPDLAGTLERIAAGGPEAVYRGPIGAAIADHVSALGGFLTRADFAAHAADWVEPIRTTYRGYTLCELPPNTQGFVALEILNILEAYDVEAMGHNSADYLHYFIEAKRIAFADRAAYLADARHVPEHLLTTLISKEYAGERRREISATKAAVRYAPAAVSGSGSGTIAGRDRGDTVYLAAADRAGNVISFINSLFNSFGSGIVVPRTGIALHSRGSGFSLQAGHPNELAPGKRPFHTLVPAFLMRGADPVMAFGVMGGDNQAQAHAQIVANVVDFGMDVQAAGDAARVRHTEDGLAAESGIPEHVRADLRARGHVVFDGRGMVGGYQAVRVDSPDGVLQAGSDPRKDGHAAGW
jgi:gamma-glutamyltranspeptidase/glutathione hydrolase